MRDYLHSETKYSMFKKNFFFHVLRLFWKMLERKCRLSLQNPYPLIPLILNGSKADFERLMSPYFNSVFLNLCYMHHYLGHKSAKVKPFQIQFISMSET